MRALWWFMLLLTMAPCSRGVTCPHKCRCDRYVSGNWEVICPAKDELRIKVIVQPGKALHMQCTEKTTTQDFDFLQDLLTGPTPSLIYRQCPPPPASFANLSVSWGNPHISSLIYASYRNLSHQLSSAHLADLYQTTHLRLPHNGFTSLSEDLLSQTPNITNLDLIDNFITNIPKNFFLNVPKLTTLELGNNKIKEIENNLFQNLENLSLLNLWNNEIKFFKGDEFSNLKNLKSLDLHSNLLENLPVDLFKDLTNLKLLNLMRNEFITLPSGLLEKCLNLKVFKLTDNGKNLTLPGKFLANLEFLEEVYLMNNGIFELPSDLFMGSEFVKNISLSGNVLPELPVGIFDSQANLLKLDLSFNKFSHLPDEVFRKLLNLKSLNLGYNKLTKISRDLLSNQQNLEYLNLEHNMLSTIDSLAFIQLSNLREADLSSNRLTLTNEVSSGSPFMADFMVDEFGNRSPFHACLKMEKLILTNNSISEMFQDWRNLMLGLKVLDLSFNSFFSLQAEELSFLSPHVTVNLRHNKIGYVQTNRLWAYARDEPTSRSVPRLYLADNPLKCDCTAYDLWQYAFYQLPSSVYGLVRLELDGLRCEGPSGLDKRPFLNVTAEELKCPLTKDCPQPCGCAYRSVDSAVLVDCSSKGLTKVPEILPVVPKSNHTELLLDNNSLTSLPNTSLPVYRNVTHLYLSHNQLRHLEPGLLTDRLVVLTADHNNLTHMGARMLTGVFSNSSALRLVTLHANPWACDCDNRDMLSWLQRRYKLVSFLGNVTCSDGKVLNKLSASDLCPAPRGLILLGVAIAATGVIVGMLVALYYRYQQHIRVWMYAHKCCLWWVTEEELDRDKRFDAFVSFSHKDEDFVIKQLVPKLEESGLTLCVHYRDWIAGEWIPNQIARSVESSRRTLIVLSPNFLDSVWGRLEFRAAHQQAMSEGRARVVMLLYGDLPPTEQMDPELRAYISVNTYVKWGDPWFWEKLRYALPHAPLPPIKEVKIGDRLELMSANLTPTSVPTTPPALATTIMQPNFTKVLDESKEFSPAAIC